MPEYHDWEMKVSYNGADVVGALKALDEFLLGRVPPGFLAKSGEVRTPEGWYVIRLWDANEGQHGEVSTYLAEQGWTVEAQGHFAPRAIRDALREARNPVPPPGTPPPDRPAPSADPPPPEL